MRRKSRSRWLASVAALAVLIGPNLNGGGAVAAAPHSSVASVKPNAVNELDCNGLSPKYKSVKAGLSGFCVDPARISAEGDKYRFTDNGRYIGHDEPSVKFISSTPGSGNDMTYFMRLSHDPAQKPTATSIAVSDYGQLSIAPWFGLAMCDPNSFPLNPCTPDSDTNSGNFTDPSAAGSAFMELQFYPPGFAPFLSGVSCDQHKWCSALNIDSLACTSGFAFCNPICQEPVNFSYLQQNGVPSGPPSPQLADTNTFTPNRQTLEMNDGDDLRITIHDTSQGLLTRVDDISNGQSGYMVASAANGFMNTDPNTCDGAPFSFHPEYDTAAQQNVVPWSSLESGVLMQQEIGHFEVCSSVKNQIGSTDFYGDGQTFSDPQVYQTCVGGTEGSHATGEGPCNRTTGICQHATTQAGIACPTNDFTTNALCEFSDAGCMPLGGRIAKVNGATVAYSWPVAGCIDNVFQNGDLDFDGTSYQADWPDGSLGHPKPFEYLGPFTGSSQTTYPTVQFESNVGGSEIFCDIGTGNNCTVPPIGANFYPFWSLGRVSAPQLDYTSSQPHSTHTCVWSFGNVISHKTVTSFGGDAQYGTPDVAVFGGTLISAPTPNPQLANQC